MSDARIARSAFLFIAFCVLLPAAHALTASPASVTFQSSDGDAHYALTITNDEDHAIAVTLTPTGPLASSLVVEANLTLAVGESRSVPVTLHIPEAVQPGTVESGILVESGATAGGMVAASASVLHVVRLVTPRDGAFLTGELVSSSGIVGSPTLVTLAVTNTGSESLVANPVVFLDGQRITLDPISLAPGESKQAVVPWTPRAIGSYESTATVSYAGKQSTFGTTITVGELSVELTSLSYGAFRLGDPFRVSVDAINRWGAPLPVVATATLAQGGAVIATSVPVQETVDPLHQVGLAFFLESASAHVGNATITVTAQYADRRAVQAQDVILGVDSITAVVPSASSAISLFTVVLIVVVLVGIGFAISFIYRRRFQRK